MLILDNTRPVDFLITLQLLKSFSSESQKQESKQESQPSGSHLNK